VKEGRGAAEREDGQTRSLLTSLLVGWKKLVCKLAYRYEYQTTERAIGNEASLPLN